MRSVSYRLADLKKNVTVPLGFRGENEHTRIIIDCKKAFDEYPRAIPSLAVKNPDGTAYPAVIVREGDLVYWDVRDSDLVKEGRGTAQLTFTEDGVVRKDDIFNTVIGKSIFPAGPAPDPVADWVEEANKALEDVEHAIEAAVHAPVINSSGYWSIWDSDTDQYVSTGVKAQGEDGDDGVGIVSIEKTGTSGLVDTYTITFTSGSTVTDTVTNGLDGDPGMDATPDLITEDYSDLTFPVAEEKLCYHEGLLYKANQAIQSSEAWTAAHWTQTTIEAEINSSVIEENLLRSEIPGTSTTVTMDNNGNPTSIVHTANSETVRTDSFVWSTNSVVETRTLASGKYITITTNLETLAQTISEVQEVA